MITNLRTCEIAFVVGGRFLPGIINRLNNGAKGIFETGVMRDIGHGFETIGKEIKKVVITAGAGGERANGRFEIEI